MKIHLHALFSVFHLHSCITGALHTDLWPPNTFCIIDRVCMQNCCILQKILSRQNVQSKNTLLEINLRRNPSFIIMIWETWISMEFYAIIHYIHEFICIVQPRLIRNTEGGTVDHNCLGRQLPWGHIRYSPFPANNSFTT